MTKRGYRRGYPVALLVGLEADRAVLWQVFSHVVKLHKTVRLAGNRREEQEVYNFHESVVNALKPMLKEGIRSVVVTTPPKTTYASEFLDHVHKHHGYLVRSNTPDTVTFGELIGSANQPRDVAELVKTKTFRRLIEETTSDEADLIVDALEKRLSVEGGFGVLFSLGEIEDAVYDHERHGGFRSYLMLTDKYLEESKDKNRIHRLLQISANKKVKTRVINAETRAGKRVSQLGGIVFFAMPE